uniref:Ubiquitin-like protease family profile domain-containing protein n=1 Tax=Plectus sambesii TaxID=2011161 RepID=A0A914X5Y6_9BILA
SSLTIIGWGGDMNWNDATVVRALERYCDKEIATQVELQATLEALTGVRVPKSTLSDRVKAFRVRTGRLSTTEQPPTRSRRPSVKPPLGSALLATLLSRPPPVVATSRKRAASPGSASFDSDDTIPAISAGFPEPGAQFTEGALSARFSSTLLTVPAGDGFVRQYRLSVERLGVRYYRCSQCDTLHRKGQSNIMARASVRDGVLTLNQPRHHPDCRPIRALQALATNIDRGCRMEVRTGRFAPRSVYDAGHQEALTLSAELGDVRSADSLVALFPYWQSVRNQYGRQRLGLKPPVASINDIPAQYRSTLRGVLTGDNERWLLSCHEEERVFVFAADSDLRLAAECDVLVGDATYKASPKGSYQLFTLHAKYVNSTGASEWVAVAFALMGSKTRAAYDAVFAPILTKWAELGCQPRLTKFLVDFDPAQLGAVAAAFGTDKVKGCLFHQSQAILREVRFKGLIRYYDGSFGEKNVIWRWLRHICALPFLPPKLAQVVWDADLCRPPRPPKGWVAPDGFGGWPTVQLRKFARYVRRQWFGGMPLMWWNHWATETDRTTNAAEAFHSMLSKQQTTLAHPSLTNFVPWLQQIHSRLQTRMVQLQAGAKTRPKDQRYVKLDERIGKYKTDFQRELLQCPDMGTQMLAAERYLSRCSYLLSDIDGAGLRSRKAARALRKKYSKLDAKRLVAPDPPKRRRPSKARKPAVQPPTQPPPMPMSSPSPTPTPSQPTPTPTSSKPTEFSWSTEKAWLENSSPKQQPLSSGQSESTQTLPTDKPLPSTVTNIADDDLNTLRGRSWLNDMVISSYLALIQARSQLGSRERVYAFLTFFYDRLCNRGYIGVRSWVKTNVFSYDLLLFPIHDHGNHWTLIVVNMPRWRISFYDSMGGNGDHHLQIIHDLLRAEFADKHPTRPFVPFTCVTERRLPQQQNTRDCGVFMCQYAEHLSRKAPLSFTQADIPRFRLQMERELKEGRLL